MVKQIPDNEIYLLIKHIKSVLWRVAKCLSYIEDARCLKVNWTCVCVLLSWRVILSVASRLTAFRDVSNSIPIQMCGASIIITRIVSVHTKRHTYVINIKIRTSLICFFFLFFELMNSYIKKKHTTLKSRLQ